MILTTAVVVRRRDEAEFGYTSRAGVGMAFGRIRPCRYSPLHRTNEGGRRNRRNALMFVVGLGISQLSVVHAPARVRLGSGAEYCWTLQRLRHCWGLGWPDCSESGCWWWTWARMRS